MTAPRDTNRGIRAFLAPGPTELADRSFDAVRASIERTPQRAFLGPWRFPQMQAFAKVLGAVAVVSAIALAGFALLSSGAGQPSVGGPSMPSASASAPPTASASAPPSLAVGPPTLGAAQWVRCDDGATIPDCIAPGTYHLSEDITDSTVTLDVPAGWVVWDPGVGQEALLVDGGPIGSGWGVMFSTVDTVFRDPCEPDAGSFDRADVDSVDELVAAMASWPGFSAGPVQPTTVGGVDGSLVELTALSTLEACPSSNLWATPADLDGYPMVHFEPGPHTGTYRVLDVGGDLLVIRTTDFPETSPAELAQGIESDPTRHADDQLVLDAIIDSIRIAEAGS